MTLTAHAFHPNLNKGKERGSIEVHSDRLSFTSAYSAQRFEIDFDLMELSRGGAGKTLLYIKSSRDPDLTIYLVGFELLDAPELQRIPRAQKLSAEAKLKSRVWTMSWGLAGLLVIAIPLGLVIGHDAVIDQVVERIPAKWEVQLGEQAFNPYRQDPMVKSPKIEAAIREVCAPLADLERSTGYPFKFHVSFQPDSLNAFAMPGGHVVIHSSLIMAVKRPEALLGVVGHEIAHVTERHSLRAIVEKFGLYTILSFFVGDASAIGGMILSEGAELLTLKASRDQEREADEVAWQLMLRANIDPTGLAEVFKVLREENGSETSSSEPSSSEISESGESSAEGEGTSGSSRILTLLSTHPDLDKRIAHFKARHATLTEEEKRPLATTHPKSAAAFKRLQKLVREMTPNLYQRSEASSKETPKETPKEAPKESSSTPAK